MDGSLITTLLAIRLLDGDRGFEGGEFREIFPLVLLSNCMSAQQASAAGAPAGTTPTGMDTNSILMPILLLSVLGRHHGEPGT